MWVWGKLDVKIEKMSEREKKSSVSLEEQFYGHGARNLVQKMYSVRNKSEEEQKQALKEYAEKLVQKYGDGILNVMAPELLDALGIKK